MDVIGSENPLKYSKDKQLFLLSVLTIKHGFAEVMYHFNLLPQ